MYLFCDRKFVLHKDLMDKEKGLLCENSLSIVCEVHEFTNEVSYINNWLLDPLKSTMVHSTKHTLGNDLKQILDSGENSDVVLVASDGREFPAHTLILSSRSTVFAAMFKHDMKESRENRVDIDDLSSEAVAGLLNFIYTDTTPDIIKLAPQLLFVAHKYNIPGLILLCEETMVSCLTTANAANYFALADLHGARQLRLSAKHFISTHLKAVKATDKWKTSMEHSPHLVDEILDEMAELMAQLTSS